MEMYGFKVTDIVKLVSILCIPVIISRAWFIYTTSAICFLYAAYFIYKKTNKNTISVNGKGVFITGCDSGFGYALAKHLDTLGFTVFAGCLFGDSEGANTLKSSKTGRMHVIKVDVTKDESVADAVKVVKNTISKKKQDLWAVVNNAGVQVFGEVEFCTMDLYHRVAEVNIFGMVRTTKAFLPLIRQSKGRIINVTSVKGRLGWPFNAAYGITKYGGETYSDILRLEMRKFGVKVIVFEPGNFAGITGIINAKNLETIKREIDKMWDAADDEVKDTYGKEYYDVLYKSLDGHGSDGCPSFDPINEAFVDALTNITPQYRYLVHGGKGWFDEYCVLAVMNMFMPTSLMDYLLEKISFRGMPKVKAFLE